MTILSLGYLRMRSPNADAWPHFAGEVLGFMPVDGITDDGQAYRWDSYPYRLTVAPGDELSIDAIGYEVTDDRGLDRVVETLEKAGVEVRTASSDEAAELKVSGLARFTDPAGAPIELFHGPILDHVPVVTPKVSGFVTGEMGMGHVVINVDDVEAESDFYRDVLGFHRRNTWYFQDMAMAFFGCNPRHHTFAIGKLPMPSQMIHFMVEMATIDDVGYALDRCLDANVPIAMGLGRHTNDHMISFYCATPDGYMVEVGWGGLQVETPDTEATYQITRPSFWGHRPLKP